MHDEADGVIWQGADRRGCSTSSRIDNAARGIVGPSGAARDLPSALLGGGQDLSVRRTFRTVSALASNARLDPDPVEGLRRFRQRFAVPDADDSPVFLFSAGWRSASTALQRLVLSSRECLIWGEPYAQLNWVQDLARSFAAFTLAWPYDDFLIDEVLPSGVQVPADRWTANLYPSPADLITSVRDHLRRLYAIPAQRRGYTRWGIKEVRFGAAEIRFLHLLFPRAQFVLLTRNPYDAWRSFRRHLPDVWHRRWPSEPVATTDAFGRMWAELVHDFQSVAEDVGAMMVRAEDLGDPSTVQALRGYLGLDIDPEVLDERIGSTTSRGLTAWERHRLRARVGSAAEPLGYRP